MFTIEVKKKGADEEFSFADLEMFHRECGGGQIKAEYGKEESHKKDWLLTCQRCRTKEIMRPRETGDICLTAIDGKDRNFEAIFGEDELRVGVIQKV